MSEPELWRTAKPGERQDEHICSDYCHDEERAVGLVRVPFDEAVQRMMRIRLGDSVLAWGTLSRGEAEAALRAALGEDTHG